METATESTKPHHRQCRPRRTRHELGVRELKKEYRTGLLNAAPSFKEAARAVAGGRGPLQATAKRWVANKGTR